MKLDDFDYRLPEELIAQRPAEVRDASRLLCLDRSVGRIRHRSFRDLPTLLGEEDLLVLNDSRVIPARLFARRPGAAGTVEILLLEERESGVWAALVRPGRKARAGERLIVAADRFEAVVMEAPGAVRLLRFEWDGDFAVLLDELGAPPLPPYIQRGCGPAPEDKDRYQTVFAAAPGSVAAPTAGLHFTPQLLERLPHCTISLHVGYGTFKPIHCQDVSRHRMDSEAFVVSEEAAQRINAHRRREGRLVAVGSTSTRVLEHLMLKYGEIRPGPGRTELFIRPGHRFQAVDSLITNFHLPRSTLLVLVSAFAGSGRLRHAYQEAIQQRYRFYSYGDAMLIQ